MRLMARSNKGGCGRKFTQRGRIPAIVASLIAVAATSLAVSSKPSPAASPAPKPSPTATAKSSPAFKWPEPVVGTSQDIGTSSYLVSGAIANTMKKAQGINVRIVPVGTEQGRITLLMRGRAHFAVVAASTNFLAQEGVFDYASLEWGPQPLYLAVAGRPLGQVGFVTAKDANIKTWADAKGKRMVHVLGFSASWVTGMAQLAFGNLTWNDVKIVEVPSIGAGGRAVIEGRADIGFGGSTTAWSHELASSPRGIFYPPMPFKDEAGWKRALAVAPYMAQTVTTVGAGLSEKNPVEASTYGFMAITVHEGTDAEFVYQLTKKVNELYPQYSSVGLGVEQLSPERQTLSSSNPYHEGAIRYYKEIGRWTADNQKSNEAALARQKTLKEAWRKAIVQAAEQNTASKDFPGFWMKVRAQSLEAAKLNVIFR